MKKQWKGLLALCCLLLTLALPAWAEEAVGVPDITPQTTMGELRANPAIQRSGIFTYTKVWEQDCELAQKKQDGLMLQEVVRESCLDSCVQGLNYLIETVNAGTQVTYKLYSPEEITQDAGRDHAELYYFPAKEPGAKYAVVLSGNAIINTSNLQGGVSTAWELHQQGYAVFSLRYRIGVEAGNNAPLEDLGRAIQLITAHAEEFGIRTDNYALVGYSSGGQISGVFAGESDVGYRHYNVPKPGVLMLGYPVNDFNWFKPAYRLVMDTMECEKRYYDYNVSDGITAQYPPTYLWYGKKDDVLAVMDAEKQGPELEKALRQQGVPCIVHAYENAPHVSGVGYGTDAEGWLKEAAAFWEEQAP